MFTIKHVAFFVHFFVLLGASKKMLHVLVKIKAIVYDNLMLSLNPLHPQNSVNQVSSNKAQKAFIHTVRTQN
jgi:hypothetical protein